MRTLGGGKHVLKIKSMLYGFGLLHWRRIGIRGKLEPTKTAEQSQRYEFGNGCKW